MLLYKFTPYCTIGLTRNDALAAVMVPCGLTKAGFSLAICSGVDTLMPLSAFTASPFPTENTQRDDNYTHKMVQMKC